MTLTYLLSNGGHRLPPDIKQSSYWGKGKAGHDGTPHTSADTKRLDSKIPPPHLSSASSTSSSLSGLINWPNMRDIFGKSKRIFSKPKSRALISHKTMLDKAKDDISPSTRVFIVLPPSDDIKLGRETACEPQFDHPHRLDIYPTTEQAFFKESQGMVNKHINTDAMPPSTENLRTSTIGTAPISSPDPFITVDAHEVIRFTKVSKRSCSSAKLSSSEFCDSKPYEALVQENMVKLDRYEAPERSWWPASSIGYVEEFLQCSNPSMISTVPPPSVPDLVFIYSSNQSSMGASTSEHLSRTSNTIPMPFLEAQNSSRGFLDGKDGPIPIPTQNRILDGPGNHLRRGSESSFRNFRHPSAPSLRSTASKSNILGSAKAEEFEIQSSHPMTGNNTINKRCSVAQAGYLATKIPEDPNEVDLGVDADHTPESDVPYNRELNTEAPPSILDLTKSLKSSSSSRLSSSNDVKYENGIQPTPFHEQNTATSLTDGLKNVSLNTHIHTRHINYGAESSGNSGSFQFQGSSSESIDPAGSSSSDGEGSRGFDGNQAPGGNQGSGGDDRSGQGNEQQGPASWNNQDPKRPVKLRCIFRDCYKKCDTYNHLMDHLKKDHKLQEQVLKDIRTKIEPYKGKIFNLHHEPSEEKKEWIDRNRNMTISGVPNSHKEVAKWYTTHKFLLPDDKVPSSPFIYDDVKMPEWLNLILGTSKSMWEEHKSSGNYPPSDMDGQQFWHAKHNLKAVEWVLYKYGLPYNKFAPPKAKTKKANAQPAESSGGTKTDTEPSKPDETVDTHVVNTTVSKISSVSRGWPVSSVTTGLTNASEDATRVYPQESFAKLNSSGKNPNASTALDDAQIPEPSYQTLRSGFGVAPRSQSDMGSLERKMDQMSDTQQSQFPTSELNSGFSEELAVCDLFQFERFYSEEPTEPPPGLQNSHVPLNFPAIQSTLDSVPGSRPLKRSFSQVDQEDVISPAQDPGVEHTDMAQESLRLFLNENFSNPQGQEIWDTIEKMYSEKLMDDVDEADGDNGSGDISDAVIKG